MAKFEIRNLRKNYVNDGKLLPVLCGIDMALEDGDFMVIAGQSGCGKTTLLRILAGLEEYDGGQLSTAGKMRIGMVFQEPRLMPWLSVYENVAFGVEKPDRARIMNLIGSVRLQGFENMKPAQLSGGMQHRTALARALALNPDVLLMDEPFAALDYFTRMTMQDLLIELYLREKVTVVFVTHSIDEALILGRHVALLGKGRISDTYDLSSYAYPRDITLPEIAEMRKKILSRIMAPQSRVLSKEDTQ